MVDGTTNRPQKEIDKYLGRYMLFLEPLESEIPFHFPFSSPFDSRKPLTLNPKSRVLNLKSKTLNPKAFNGRPKS